MKKISESVTNIKFMSQVNIIVNSQHDKSY